MNKTEMAVSLLSLPDDCLLSILKELNVFDLLSVHRTCRRLHTIGKYCITLIHTTVSIEFIDNDDYEIQIDGVSKCQTNRYGLAKLLKNIGKSISFLTLEGKNVVGLSADAAPIFEIMNKNCGVHLKKLSLLHITMEKNNITKFRNVFKQLEKLHIEGKSGLAKYVTYNKNLRDVTIITSNAASSVFLKKTYPKLESFCYTFGKNTRVTTKDAERFFKNHPNLKTVRMWKVFIPTMLCLNYLQNIETLLIDLDTASSADLQTVEWTAVFQLHRLKTLQLVLNEHDLGDSLSRVTRRYTTNIECLELKIYHFKDFCDLFTTFTYNKLRELKISFDLVSLRTVGDVSPEVVFGTSFSSNLRNIESLAFKDFPKDFYERYIVELVRNAPNLKVLTLFPIFMSEITAEDLLRLSEINASNRNALTVNYGNCLNIVVKLAAMKNGSDPNGNILRFRSVERFFEW